MELNTEKRRKQKQKTDIIKIALKSYLFKCSCLSFTKIIVYFKRNDTISTDYRIDNVITSILYNMMRITTISVQKLENLVDSK